jgi:hypothetical protein
MKKALIVSVLLSSVTALGFSQTAFAVRNTATWIEAVGGIRNGGNDKEYVITVTGTVSVPSTSDGNTFGSVTGVTITIEGNGTLSPSANGSLLVIGKDQTIIAKDITLKGRDNNNASVVNISSGGTFRMEGKASVTGNKRTSGGGNLLGYRSNGGFGSGVFVDGGTFTMQDSASVSGNTATYRGGGVSVGRNGTFTMKGGTISGNTASPSDRDASAYCGGVSVDGGTFTMQDGTISGNTANSSYGGVSVDYNGTFTMHGGTISGNIATDYDGGGVSVGSGTFTMQGGTISGNTANRNGGGGVYANGGTFTMKDGIISGNTATYGGGGVYIISGAFTMQDGTISGNTAERGGGVYGTITMKGGTISGNTATYYGGGVYGHDITKTGGTVYGDDAEQKLKNTVISGIGHALYNESNKNWRNTGAGPTMNTESYGFWLNEGDLVMFPSGFARVRDWRRSNFNNTLTITENIIKSSSSNYFWVLQRISGNVYTLKRADASNTMTLTIRLDGSSLIISGDSGSGENNWNGTWR